MNLDKVLCFATGSDDQAFYLEENLVLAPLVVATLKALSTFTDTAFRTYLRDFFPLLTKLISCRHAPKDVQAALSDLFVKRIGPLL